MDKTSAIDLYNDFSEWVQKEHGYIQHYAKPVPGEHVSAWSACAVGCFCKVHDTDIDELTDAIEYINPGLFFCLNASYPETFEQLAIMVELGSEECEEIHAAALVLQDHFGGL